ncbi:MAG TPA: response regulator transcription factor [Stellaceae bacterium]|nr:response regulator transcription factor [Stellaceae bacterium]HYC12617.1 response regulator transcription factor [Stellaceae bacterium]
MRILLIEDDDEAGAYLARGLSEGGHQVDLASDGRVGLERAAGGGFDAMVIDRMLPGMDGLAIVAELRRRKDATPILILSALGDVEDRVQGLRAGCDDYLSKPFAFSELLARIEAIERRSHTLGETRLKLADLDMDLLKRTVTRAGRAIDLLPREFRLLEYLLRNAGHVVTRTMLLEKVWDHHFDPQTNVIDVHVSRLRQKIDRDFSPPLLHTVRGAGYVLRE